MAGLAQAGAATGNPYAAVAGAVLDTLMSGGETSSAAGGSSTGLNTSGWVVGEGDAQGGQLSMSNAAALPWYAWAVGALVAIAIIKKAV